MGQNNPALLGLSFWKLHHGSNFKNVALLIVLCRFMWFFIWGLCMFGSSVFGEVEASLNVLENCCGSVHRYRMEIPDLLCHSLLCRHQPWSSSYRNLGPCRPHMQIQRQAKIFSHVMSTSFACQSAFHMCLSSYSVCSWCRWHMYLTNHILITKKPKYSKLEPHAGEKWHQRLASLICICEINSTLWDGTE